MSLANTLEGILSNFREWEKRGLNEAQTIQAIILPIVVALGWNIDDPFEVFPQKNNGGAFKNIPDYTLAIEEVDKVILESKALGRTLSPDDRAQLVTYLSIVGLRWGILTNGKTWEFLDNSLEAPASEKVALTLDLLDARIEKYLEALLSRSTWLTADAKGKAGELTKEIQQDIRNRLHLSKIEDKLRDELKEGFTHDPKGLEKAISLTLDANERDLAIEHFGELAQKLLGEGNPNPPRQLMQSDNAVIPILRTAMKQAVEQGRITAELRVWLDGEELKQMSWRSIHVGVAETMLRMGRETDLLQNDRMHQSVDERRKASGELYEPSGYRKLSNGMYLFLHMSAAEHQRYTQRLLQALSLPSAALQIEYQGKIYKLP
jgi:hypothetical protein